ncbi:MAG: transporter substrate-binding domain-containing protein [Prevotella sp.]|nr:transporter substrate-binding domain-containing protein [Prevotella sp.]
MTRRIFRNGRRLVALLFGLFTSLPFYSFNYTEEHPLVIVSDWDFRPFEYTNAEGQPAGYNVDVLNMILDQLGIPHKFVMQEWHVATEMFKRREADLIHALYYFFKDQPYVSTHKYINYYNLKVARRTGTEPLHWLSDLKANDTLQLKEDDYAALALAGMGTVPFATEYHSPKEGLAGVRQGIYKYYIWGEIPLRHKIQELGLDSIVLDEIDIPAGELRIIGYDKELVDIIDDQYTRLEQAGELQTVYDRWFRPEREHHDTSPVVLFILAGLLLAAVIVFLLIRLVRRRVGINVRESSDLGRMMDQVLNMGEYYVVEWDLQKSQLRNKYGDMLPQGEMKPEEFLQRMLPEEAKQLHSLNTQLVTGVINHFDMNFSFNQGTLEKPVWKVFYGNAIVETDPTAKKPKFVLLTTKDITGEINEERRVKTAASKYKKIFDTNLVAMSFYDANGVLLDCNRKMTELLGEENEEYFRGILLFNFPNLTGILMPGSLEVIHVCQHFEEPQLGIDKYIEFRVHPVIDENGELVYYIATSRDITAERNMYLKQREYDRQLQNVNEGVRRYEEQLCYLLKESRMYIWNYLPAENVINMSRTTGQAETSETMEEYLLTVCPDARQRAQAEIQTAMHQGKPYNTILPFDHTLFDNEASWYAVSGIPITDKDGHLIKYFGLARNITDLMQAQEKLRIETARAEDSGRQKATFLANMTHEIRTPLNAIVGFSDLLPMIDNSDEKKELMRIIRSNCDMLLRLTSDILEASDIDSRPMAIEPADVDFAQAFDDICQTLEQRVQTSNVTFIKDNPYTTFNTRLDKGRIQQVITNFVTNAIKYTHQGYIKVGYCATPSSLTTLPPSLPQEEGLFICCEDTGAGIPKEKQASVFERFVKLNEFVQGTGLGLNISKSIAERCGGRIGVISDGEGRGSTFWVWIPCPHYLPDEAQT